MRSISPFSSVSKNIHFGFCLQTLFLALLGASLLAPVANAQYRAGLRGAVADPSGALVAEVKVTLVSKDTNRTLVASSDENGIFNFNNLAPGRYSLTFEKNGFKKKVLDEVGIIADQAQALNVQIEVGNVTETVTVSADSTPLIDTETATVGGTVSSQQIQKMPSYGRDVFALLQLAPGLFGDGSREGNGDTFAQPGNQGPGGSGGTSGVFATENRPQVTANGGRQNSNNIMLDGIGITSVSWGGAAIVTPNEDSIKEVRVVSNSYDAEHGRFSGAQVEVISQNGTNQYHGSAFFKADRPGLNAFQHWNGTANAPATPLRNEARFNQWGGSVGGPILKNKVFGFFSYETIRNSSTVKDNQWFETPQLLASAPAGSIAAKYAAYPGESPKISGVTDQSCFSIDLQEGINCHMVPGKGLDIGRPLTSALGAQDPSFVNNLTPGLGGDGLGGSNNLDGVADIMFADTVGPNNTTNQQFNGRLDFNATDRDLLAFSIYRVPATTLSYNGFRSANLFHHDAINEAETVLWNHTFSPTLINQARLNAAGWRWNELTSNPQVPLGLPQPAFIGDEGSGGNIGSVCPGCNKLGGPAGSIFNQWTYSAKDTLTKVHRSHTLKFGAEVTQLHFVQDAPWSARPNFGFNNYWDFLNDAPVKEVGTFNPLNGSPTDVRKDSRSTLLGFFVQDDWKLRSNLTINLGLRWEYFGPVSFIRNQLSTVVLGSGANALTGLRMRLGGNLYNADKHNFGPQLGFAWGPDRFSGRLVIRGGFGMAYNGEEQAITLNGWTNIPFTNGNATLTGPNIVYAVPNDPRQFLPYPANPNTVLNFDANNLPTTGAPVSVTAFPANYPTSYTYRYSLQGQYDLGRNWVSTVGYQGSSSRHLTRQSNLNLIYGAKGIALNPRINNVDYYSQDANANFNALFTELQHRFAQSFEMDVQYRFASGSDNSSGPYTISNYQWDPRADWGSSDYDVTHAFKVWGIYSPTIFRGSHGWLEKVAGGWSISGILNAHSGFPWSPVFDGSCNYIYNGGACTNGGQTQLLPAKYLGGAGSDFGNSTFLKAGGNFSKGGPAYFVPPTFTECTVPFPATCQNVPQAPGVARNSFRGPRYFSVDATLSKAFGLPKLPVMGEGAKIEFRMNAFNLFNSLNLKTMDNVVTDSLFGQAKEALGGRTIEMQARFNF